MTWKTIKRDLSLKDFKYMLTTLEKYKDKVGIQTGAGRYEEGSKIVDVAIWNEFGSEKVVARPSIRTFLLYKTYRNIITYRFKLEIELLKRKKQVAVDVFEKVGENASFVIQSRIKGNDIKPALSPLTLAFRKKKGNMRINPLWDSGLYLSKIENKTVIK